MNTSAISESEQLTISTYWGFIAGASAGIFNSIGLSIQKNVHRKNITYYKDFTWWLGFFMLIFAELLGSISYGFIAAYIVVSLSALSIVGSLLISSCNESLTFVSILGTLSIIVGCLLSAVIVPSEKSVETIEELKKYIFSWSSLIYQVSVVIVCAMLHLVYFKLKKNIIIIASYAAFVSSITIIWAKCLVLLLLKYFLNDENNVFQDWLIYVSFIIVCFTGIYSAGILEQVGLKEYNQSDWVPVHFVMCLISFLLAGIIVFDELIILSDALSVSIFINFILLFIWGVCIISISH